MSFGEVKISFREEKLLELVYNKDITGVMNYVKSYFIKLSTAKSSVMWIPGEFLFEIKDDQLIRSRYIQNLTIPICNKKGKVVDVWSLQEWYFSL